MEHLIAAALKLTYQTDMLVVGCVQVRNQLCGGKLLRLKQGVEPVHNADVQLTVHGAQIHLDLGLSGHHTEATFSTLHTEPDLKKKDNRLPRRLPFESRALLT